jgi:hypothetical protein
MGFSRLFLFIVQLIPFVHFGDLSKPNYLRVILARRTLIETESLVKIIYLLRFHLYTTLIVKEIKNCLIRTDIICLNPVLRLTEIVMDGGGSLGDGDSSFRDTRSEADGIDVAGGDSPPSPGTRRSRRHRSRGSATSSMDCTGEATEKKEKTKKGVRKNRKKDKDKTSAGDDGSSATCQDLPAVPKKSNRRKKQGSSEGVAETGKDAAEAAAEEAPLPPVGED